jgi:PAS domain S-box-containing protein
MSGPDADVVLDALSHGVVVYEPDRGEIVDANDPFCGLVDRSPATLVGSSVGEFVAGDAVAAGLVGPDCLDAARATKTLTADLRGADGPIPVAVDLRPAGESWVAATVRDARDGCERRLRRFEAIVETLDDVIYALDADGRFVYVSPSVADVKGVDPDAFLGTQFHEWVDAETAERARQEMAAIERGDREVATMEYDFERADGETIDAELRFVPLTLPDGDPGWAGLIRDITERVEHRREIERQNDRLERVARLVSHDLRNPLAVAQGHLDLIEGNEASVATIDDSLSRMERLVEDLLTLTREGQTPADLEPVSLAETARRAWASVETGDATLRVETDATVRADEWRLASVFGNLFANAVEHGAVPGDPLTVCVESLPDGFAVVDDGEGFREDSAERIFDPGHTTSETGTGLGLGIVADVVDAHDWTISVSEREAGGARFAVSGVELVDGVGHAD